MHKRGSSDRSALATSIWKEVDFAAEREMIPVSNIVLT